MMKTLQFAVFICACIALKVQAEAFPSAYAAPDGPPILLTNATILDGAGARYDNTSLYLFDGKVMWIGSGETGPDTVIVDATDRWITPGLIDVHSHLGVYPSPGVAAHSDGNEATAPVTAEVWAEHSVWPQDPGFTRALAGGVTAMQILPGSANLFGGRGVTLKNVSSLSYQGMKFPGAPHGLKMACGENPKRVYGNRNQSPSTRMGNVAAYRSAWIRAQRYQADWDRYYEAVADAESATTNGSDGASVADALLTNTPPRRNLELETLAGALRGDILVHMHCYRADEMLTILDMAEEFGYRIGTFHHGVEAYKIADQLAENGVCAALWADWWGFKIEAYDGIQENIALVDRPNGGCAIVHSDSAEGIQRLNQEAAKAMLRGNRAGLDIPPERAIRWITSNAAKSLGIQDLTGTLEAGKMADVVLWNQNPFSVYAKPLQVYIDGVMRYELGNPDLSPESDFELGQLMGAAQ